MLGHTDTSYISSSAGQVYCYRVLNLIGFNMAFQNQDNHSRAYFSRCRGFFRKILNSESALWTPRDTPVGHPLRHGALNNFSPPLLHFCLTSTPQSSSPPQT
jgi:hypothetical protein